MSMLREEDLAELTGLLCSIRAGEKPTITSFGKKQTATASYVSSGNTRFRLGELENVVKQDKAKHEARARLRAKLEARKAK